MLVMAFSISSILEKSEHMKLSKMSVGYTHYR